MKRLFLLVVIFSVGCSPNGILAPTSVPVAVTPPPRQIAVAGTRVYVALGDSITQGTGGSVNMDFVSLLQDFLNYWYPTTTALNFGTSGISAEAFASAMPYVLSNIPITPDFVTIELGINDLIKKDTEEVGGTYLMPYSSAVTNSYIFKAALTTIITSMRGMPGAHAKITLANVYKTHFADDWTDGVNVFNEYNKRVSEVAVEQGVGLVDLATVFAANPSLYISPDGIHPSDSGHYAISVEEEKCF